MCNMSMLVCAAAVSSDSFRADFFCEAELSGFSEAMLSDEFQCRVRLSKDESGVQSRLALG